jgi:signal transduction histidine kinase
MSSYIIEKRGNALLALLVMIAIAGIFTLSSVYHPIFSFRIEIIRIALLIILLLFNLFFFANIARIKIWGLKEYVLLLCFLIVNVFLMLMLIYSAGLVLRLFVFLFLMFALFFSTKKKIKKEKAKAEKRESEIEESKEKDELKEKLVEELKREAEILRKSERLIEEASKRFIGSKKNKVFHRNDCRIGKRISKDNKVYFENKSDALSSGYKPCKVCKP